MMIRRYLLAAGAALAFALPIQAQQVEHGDSVFRPQVAQPGKDVIWVPTPDEVVERMLRLAQTTASDLVYDLGAGDGKIAIMAAQKFGARSVGVEFNPDMAALGQRNAERAGVAARTKIIRGDIFETNFKDATVVTLFLLPSLNIKLRPTLLEMAPGTRIVSHAFDMDDWKADEISRIDGRTAHFWIVPAKVQGRWHLDHPVSGKPGAFSIDVTQIYQRLEGDANFEKMRSTLRDPVLSGDNISFNLTDPSGTQVAFNGKVKGNVMEGAARAGGKEFRWRAERR
jgi:SAM-dependent methyltransferase